MRIAVDNDPYLLGLFSALQNKLPEIIVIPVPFFPESSKLKFNYRLRYKLPRFLKKNNADIFVSMSGISKRLKIPQLYVLNDLANKRWTHRLQEFFSASKGIIALSENTRQEIIENSSTEPDKIFVLNKFTSEAFHPATIETRYFTKQKHTDDLEYFLYSGIIDESKNLINILKAFTLFKKRQKSSMRMLIITNASAEVEKFKIELSSYRHRDEVKLLENISEEEKVQITGSAYAMLYPVVEEEISNPALNAMKCNVPVITNRRPSIPQACIEASLQARPGDPADIAEKMMILFKDERRRNELIRAGQAAIEQLSLENTVSRLAEIISLVKA